MKNRVIVVVIFAVVLHFAKPPGAVSQSAEGNPRKAAPVFSMLYRLAVVQRARQAGFAFDDIKALFFGFAEGTRAEARWRRLADRKLTELNELAEQIASMQALLKRLKAKCHCKTLEICGKAILERGVSAVKRPPLPVVPHHS